MGDPRKQRKKFAKPSHPWQKERIDEERKIVDKYGLPKKKELWKANSILKNFKQQTKELIRRKGNPQAEKEAKDLVQKLYNLSLLDKDAKLEAVLDLNLQNILGRRLQTLLQTRSLAKTTKQARQFIVHGHVTVNGKKIDVPSYLVLRDEEHSIAFSPSSTLADEEHPERKVETKAKEEKKEVKKQKDEFIEQIKHKEAKPPKKEEVAEKKEAEEK